jgi:hypothetical protein
MRVSLIRTVLPLLTMLLGSSVGHAVPSAIQAKELVDARMDKVVYTSPKSELWLWELKGGRKTLITSRAHATRLASLSPSAAHLALAVEDPDSGSAWVEVYELKGFRRVFRSDELKKFSFISWISGCEVAIGRAEGSEVQLSRFPPVKACKVESNAKPGLFVFSFPGLGNYRLTPPPKFGAEAMAEEPGLSKVYEFRASSSGSGAGNLSEGGWVAWDATLKPLARSPLGYRVDVSPSGKLAAYALEKGEIHLKQLKPDGLDKKLEEGEGSLFASESTLVILKKDGKLVTREVPAW